MAVSKRLRFEILRRDNHACRYCGRAAPDAKLTIDHVVPTALGGEDVPDNLVAACSECNAGKTSTQPDQPLVADVSRTQILWRNTLDYVWQDWRHRKQVLDAAVSGFGEYWATWGWTDSRGERKPVPIDDNWRLSIERMIAAGFHVPELMAYVPQAMHKRGLKGTNAEWRYFCGIVWGILRDIQAMTAKEVALEEEAEAEDYFAGLGAFNDEYQPVGGAYSWLMGF